MPKQGLWGSTAAVTANDNIAVGAYRAIHEMGLRIPDDIAVASFNDISVAQFMNPPLTTVHLAAEELAKVQLMAALCWVSRTVTSPTTRRTRRRTAVRSTAA